MKLNCEDNKFLNELYEELVKGIESLDKNEKYSSKEVYDELEKI